MKRWVVLWLLWQATLLASALPIIFKGNDHIPSTSLYEVMGIPKPLFFEFWKEKPKIDPRKAQTLLRPLEAFYKSHGFYHTRARMRLEKRRIVIEIDEGPPIRIADIAVISPLKISDAIPFKKEDRFDAASFVKSKKAIERIYTDHHYCNVLLDAKAFVDIEKNLAYLVYDLHPNKPCIFGKITITSSPSISPNIVRSLLYFKEGDPYSTELIRRSYREIYSNEGVERVVIDDRTHQGERVPVHVDVTAYGRPLHFTSGVGYSTDEGVNLQAAVKHRNFFGNLKTVGLQARYSQIKRYVTLSGEMPLTHHNRLGTDLSVRREIFDGFDEYAIKASINLKHHRYPKLYQESLIVESIDTRRSRDPNHFPNGNLLIVSPKLGFEIDTRNSLLDPTSGYRIIAEAMGSLKSALSDATYYKLTLSAAYDRKLSWCIASTKGYVGTIDVLKGRIPPSYRFYPGGMHSNRGWRFRQLGPKNRYGDPVGAYSIAEGTLEARIPWGDRFRWVIFGDITFLGEDTTPDFAKAYIAIGPGIRYMSPMGPIGLDIGFDTGDLGSFTIHFHIGELF